MKKRLVRLTSNIPSRASTNLINWSHEAMKNFSKVKCFPIM